MGDENPPPLFRHPPQFALDDGERLGHHQVLGVVGFEPRDTLSDHARTGLVHVLLNSEMNGLVAQIVQTLALERGKQIGGQIPGRRLRAALPDFQKGIGHQILGHHPVTDIRHGDPDEIRPVLRIDLLQTMGGGIFDRAIHGRINVRSKK